MKVIEHVVFELADGASVSGFLDAVRSANIFLQRCPGFLRRQVSQRTDGNEWLDLVFWENLELALAAAEAFNSAPETQIFNGMLKKGTVRMNHFVVNYSTESDKTNDGFS